MSASSDAGGSTLTQQLVKNKLLTSEVSYRRKIQEVYLAIQVESVMDKDDILEAYLNDVYLGQSNYGMKAAAKDYFGKELSELSIRECAMLAGMIKARTAMTQGAILIKERIRAVRMPVRTRWI